MGWMILQQPNGLYARFSSVVDNFTHCNLTRAEAVAVCHDEHDLGPRSSEEKVQRADDDAHPRSYLPQLGDGLHRWRYCCRTILLIHGTRKLRDTLLEMEVEDAGRWCTETCAAIEDNEP